MVRASQRAAQARYNASAKGKASRARCWARYVASAKGKATEARYRASAKRKATAARYRATEKGQRTEMMRAWARRGRYLVGYCAELVARLAELEGHNEKG